MNSEDREKVIFDVIHKLMNTDLNVQVNTQPKQGRIVIIIDIPKPEIKKSGDIIEEMKK